MAAYEIVAVVAIFISTSNGAVYTRWGNTNCPSSAELVYSGRAAGKSYEYVNNGGGGANVLCLPDDPEYDAAPSGGGTGSKIYGAQYAVGPNNFKQPFGKVNQRIMPCAVCRSLYRTDELTIPAKLKCPQSWTMEYSGYLASESGTYGSRHPSQYICIDAALVPVGGSTSSWGATLHQTRASCAESTLNCPPYYADRDLTCVVCSK